MIKPFSFITLISSYLIGVSNAESSAIIKTNQIPKGATTEIWSPLFQASWDKFNARRQGELVKVKPENKVMSALDQFKWKEAKVMPEGGYAIFAGPATPEFATEVRNQVFKQFRYNMAINQLPHSERGEALYGVLVRDLSFQKQFFRSRKRPLAFTDPTGKNHRVAFFGTAGALSNHYGRKVRVLNYHHEKKSFILSIATDHTDEHLIVYRPETPISFDTAIAHINKAKKSPLTGDIGSLTEGYLHKNDTVKIPYLNIDVRTDFTDQLQGLRYYSKEPAPWTITKAIQITRFELFEKGARVRVETHTQGDPFGGEPSKPQKITYIPRQFICDQPFFVFIWKDKAALPYFGAWAGSGDILRTFKK